MPSSTLDKKIKFADIMTGRNVDEIYSVRPVSFAPPRRPSDRFFNNQTKIATYIYDDIGIFVMGAAGEMFIDLSNNRVVVGFSRGNLFPLSPTNTLDR